MPHPEPNRLGPMTPVTIVVVSVSLILGFLFLVRYVGVRQEELRRSRRNPSPPVQNPASDEAEPKVNLPLMPERESAAPYTGSEKVEIPKTKTGIESGRSFLGRNIELEEEKCISYTMDAEGVVTEKAEHAAPLAGGITTRYKKLLKPGAKLTVYWKTTEPCIQVFEFSGMKQEEIDLGELEAAVDPGLNSRPSSNAIRTDAGLVYVFQEE